MYGNNKAHKKKLSAIIGIDIYNWFLLLRKNKIESPYFPRLIIVSLVILLCTPFRIWDWIRYERKIRHTPITEDPIFIIGHWRSGTTHLQNLLTKDVDFGFISTFHALFPEYLGSEKIFRPFMKKSMPKKRMMDSMKLGIDLPMEDEVALSNSNWFSFFSCWIFPKKMVLSFKKYVLMEGLSLSDKQQFQKKLLRIVKKASIHQNKKQILLKNPPHTGRIPELLEVFPRAKFIFIYRNPLEVFPSTKNLYNSALPLMNFQDIDQKSIEDNIFLFYRLLMRKYELDKKTIPEGNLVEIRFEDLEVNPIKEIEKIYSGLSLKGFKEKHPIMEAYLNTLKEYKKNQFEYPIEMRKRINEEWGGFFDKLGYNRPYLN